MLEVSTLRSPSKAADHHVGFTDCGEDEFMVVDDNLLDYIDFTSCDVPSFFDADGDILPDLEVDPTELLAEFEDHHDGGAAKTKPPDDVVASSQGHNNKEESKEDEKKRLLEEEEEGQKKKKNGGRDEVLSAVTTEDDSAAAAAGSLSDTKSSASAAEGQSKKTTKPSKNSHGKRKVKVDWTPELHRKFVQAVEQLGIDKAVPSRILEIMGIECLTRHNIASHLQKYRSHKKHLMAREAEAASWAQKRQMYAAAGGPQVVAGAPRTKDMPAAGPPWVVPTIGFPPPFGRPLHVWGHPPIAVEAAVMWPRHLAPPRPLPPWAPLDPAYWHRQYNAARKWGPQSVTQGTPWVPPPMPGMMPRFPAPRPPVPGMMPHPIPMYRPMIPQTTGSKLAGLQLHLDAHPSKESIDAAIGDVLVKPWLPLPLGLKPPSLDSVMSELHKQGIPKIPPAATTGG